MNLTDLIAAYSAGHWWILALIVTLYARHMVSDKSRFPWTIPSPWLPTITSLGTLLTGVIMLQIAGKTWLQTLLESGASAVAMGFFDGLLVAFFGSDSTKVPALIRFLTMLVDDVFGTKTTTTTATTAVVESVSVKTEEIKPPSAPPPGAGGAGAVGIALLCIALPAMGLLGIAAATEGCTTQQAQAVTPPVLDLAKCVAEGALAGDSLGELVAKCGGDVPAIITALFSSKEPAVKLSKAHAEARRAVAVDAGAQ